MHNSMHNSRLLFAATMVPKSRHSFRRRNIYRCLLCAALSVYLNMPAATAADRYGEWLLEQPRSSVLTLTFKQSISVGNKIVTSELGFVCDRRDKPGIVGAVLIPFDGTLKYRQNMIPVLFQKNTDQNDPSDLLQQWKNGADYIFLESKEDIDELGSFLKTNDAEGVKAVHIFFPHDLDATPQVSTHIAISVSGFSDGFGAFQTACVPSK
jgi:hypothetical protein